MKTVNKLSDNQRLFAPSLPLWIAAAMLLAVSIFHLASAYRLNSGINHVSGTWVTLAADLADGLFYRPLVSDVGYGGTRFMPLQFALHAALIRVTGSIIGSGYALTILYALGLCGGAYYFLRRVGAGRAISVRASVLVLIGGAVQYALTTVRGDFLPAVLNLWALALCISEVRGPSPEQVPRGPQRALSFWLAAASALFALAFLAKFTTLFGFGAACLSLFVLGRRRAAYWLFGLTVAGILAGIAVTYIASGGRVWEAFSACATGGAAIPNPLRLFFRGITQDPVGIMLIGGALAGLFCLRGRQFWELPVLAFLVCALWTAGLFLSPGTDYNHLIDLEIIAALFLLSQLALKRIPAVFGAALLTVIALMAVVHVVMIRPKRDDVREVTVAAIGEIGRKAAGRPLLIEDSSVAILADQKPYLLDAFALRLVRLERPEVDRDLMQKIDAGYFAAVVLSHDIDNPEHKADEFYSRNHMGPGFVSALRGRYDRAALYARSYIYLPR